MTIFYLPDLGEGLAEADIREWYVKEGDEVTVDQPLVSMETAKAVVDVPSPFTGKILTLHGKVNDTIQTGAPFITFVSDEVKAAPEKNSVVGALEESSKKWDESEVIVGSAAAKTKSAQAMPAARVLANEMGVDLSRLTGSGPRGLITVDDVKKALGNSKPEKAAMTDAEPLRGVRKIMAQAMMQSHQEVVPVTIVDDADLTNLPEKTDITVLLLEAILAGCKAEPAMNAWFDGTSLARRLFKEVNIGVAVDTPEGLFVPVIKHADTLSKSDMRAKIDEFKKTVRDRSIAPADLQGASITLSNFGTIAGKYATPIIVPPAVAILGCGKTRDQPIVREGKIMAGRIMPISLTFDHRAATGGEATRFLAAVIEHLQKV